MATTTDPYQEQKESLERYRKFYRNLMADHFFLQNSIFLKFRNSVIIMKWLLLSFQCYAYYAWGFDQLAQQLQQIWIYSHNFMLANYNLSAKKVGDSQTTTKYLCSKNPDILCWDVFYEFVWQVNHCNFSRIFGMLQIVRKIMI